MSGKPMDPERLAHARKLLADREWCDRWEAEAKRLAARLAIFEAYRSDMSGYGQGQLTELIARVAKTKLENALDDLGKLDGNP